LLAAAAAADWAADLRLVWLPTSLVRPVGWASELVLSKSSLAAHNLLACHSRFANASRNIIDGHEQLISSQQTVSYGTIFYALPLAKGGTLQITVMNKQHKF
jgi:hypothetical protein